MKYFYFCFLAIIFNISYADDKDLVKNKDTHMLEEEIEGVIALFNDKTASIITQRQVRYPNTSYDVSYQERMINSIKLSFESWKNYRNFLCESSYYKDQMTSDYSEIVNGCILDMTEKYYEITDKDLREKLLDWER